jgi:hypothetical protein
MGLPSDRSRPASEGFAEDPRPGADAYVYCKGCGQALESRARISRPKAAIAFMMCEPCRTIHGHPLIPSPGAPTFCYRCGTPEELFTSEEQGHPTYHVCPRCLPDRVARYRAGDFDPPDSTPTAQSWYLARRRSGDGTAKRLA